MGLVAHLSSWIHIQRCVSDNLSFEQPIISFHSDIIWNIAGSLKVSFFAWRILNKRISTKDNLFCYRVCSKGQRTVSGVVAMKNQLITILGCNSFGSNWYLIHWWLRISTITQLMIWSMHNNLGFLMFLGKEFCSSSYLIGYY
jgi:hypothetical protein